MKLEGAQGSGFGGVGSVRGMVFTFWGTVTLGSHLGPYEAQSNGAQV